MTQSVSRNNQYAPSPEFQAELDQASAEIELEDTMAEASEEMEIAEIIEGSQQQGGEYGRGFSDGFYRGYKFYEEKQTLRTQAITAKYASLNKRWGLS